VEEQRHFFDFLKSKEQSAADAKDAFETIHLIEDVWRCCERVPAITMRIF
jgi:hypothetical protein